MFEKSPGPSTICKIGKVRMDITSSQISKKGMLAALAGTVLVALCCMINSAD
jgi:hypothetical protein